MNPPLPPIREPLSVDVKVMPEATATSAKQIPSWQCAPLKGIGALRHCSVEQASVCVQALRSSQASPFGRWNTEQVPVEGSQVPAMWHCVGASHTTRMPAHCPVVQTSLNVQRSPSLQSVPSWTIG